MLSNSELSTDELVNKLITKKIKDILFHDLPKAADLFRLYKVNIFPDKTDKELLMKARELRHHCVHRNGCDLEGNKLGTFNKDYVVNIAEAMKKSSDSIFGDIAGIDFNDIGLG